MRFTWGHAAIAIPVIIAVVFTGVLIKAISLKGRAELVVDNYYAKEIAYQQNIDDTKNASAIHAELTLKTTQKPLLRLTADVPLHNATGKVYVFRPSNKLLDFEEPLAVNADGEVVLPMGKFQTGAYQVQVQFNLGETSYYIEQNIFFP